MAFIVTDTWQEPKRGVEAAFYPLLNSDAVAWLLANGRDRKVRKSVGLAFALLFHIWLLALLIEKFEDVPEEAGKREAVTKMLSVFTLAAETPAPAPAPLPPAPSEAAPTPPQLAPIAQATELEISKANDVQKPEWTVSKMRALVINPSSLEVPPTPSAISGQGPQSGTGNGVGQVAGGGGGVYDPYAGASPQRRDEFEASRGAAMGLSGLMHQGPAPPVFSQEPDARLMAQLLAEIKKRLPNMRGSVDVSVRISESGTVMSTRLVGGTLPPSAQALIQQLLMGRMLFWLNGQRSPANEVRLPTIRI